MLPWIWISNWHTSIYWYKALAYQYILVWSHAHTTDFPVNSFSADSAYSICRRWESFTHKIGLTGMNWICLNAKTQPTPTIVFFTRNRPKFRLSEHQWSFKILISVFWTVHMIRVYAGLHICQITALSEYLFIHFSVYLFILLLVYSSLCFRSIYILYIPAIPALSQIWHG